jgi:predicted Zn-dependent protease
MCILFWQALFLMKRIRVITFHNISDCRIARAAAFNAVMWLLIVLIMTGCRSTNIAPLRRDMAVGSLAEDEAKLWEDARQIENQINSKSVAFKGREQAEKYLQTVLMRMIVDFNNPNFKPRLRIILDPNPNAYVLPNGAIYVNTGLVALLENEDQIASILGHEFAHFRCRHSYRERIKAENGAVVGLIAGIAAASAAGDTGLVHPVTSLWTISSISGYSKNLETEADKQGLIAMSRASYDPKESIKALQLLEKVTDPNLERNIRFSSHPRLNQRIKIVQELLMTQPILTVSSGVTKDDSRFGSELLEAIMSNAEFNIFARNLDVASTNIERCIRIRPDSAKAYFLKGEILKYESLEDANSILQAISCYQKSIGFDPNYAPPYKEIGLLHRAEGADSLARVFLVKYVSLMPEAPDAAIIKRYIKELKKE